MARIVELRSARRSYSEIATALDSKGHKLSPVASLPQPCETSLFGSPADRAPRHVTVRGAGALNRHRIAPGPKSGAGASSLVSSRSRQQLLSG